MLKTLLAAALLCAALLDPAPLQAGILPLAKLDPAAVKAFDSYVAAFESGSSQQFVKGGALWMDGQGTERRKDFEAGRAYTETRATVNTPGSQIHHLFGTIRIPSVTLRDVTSTMQSYTRYPEFYKPDIAKGSSEEQADSRPELKHFVVFLQLVQSTAWIDVAFDTSYDTRYEQLDPQRVNGISRSRYLREYKNAKRQEEGTYPEADDHGFLWRTYTSWHLRERAGGVDLEMNNISLSRPVPFGFGWWANRTAKAAVEKMIERTAEAIRRSKQAAFGPRLKTSV